MNTLEQQNPLEEPVNPRSLLGVIACGREDAILEVASSRTSWDSEGLGFRV